MSNLIWILYKQQKVLVQLWCLGYTLILFKYSRGYIYVKTLFVVYLKLQFNWLFCILWGNSTLKDKKSDFAYFWNHPHLALMSYISL